MTCREECKKCKYKKNCIYKDKKYKAFDIYKNKMMKVSNSK